MGSPWVDRMMWVFHLWARGSIYVFSSATVVYRPNISVLGVSELLWWGFVEPLHLVNWHSHLGRNMIKYIFCVRANQEPAQNTSLQLYLSMCGLAPCKMLTSNLTFPQGREPATKRCCCVKTGIYKKRNRSSCRMTNRRLIFSLTAMYFWNCMLADDQVFKDPTLMKLTQFANDHVSVKMEEGRENNLKKEDGNCSYMVYVWLQLLNPRQHCRPSLGPTETERRLLLLSVQLLAAAQPPLSTPDRSWYASASFL